MPSLFDIPRVGGAGVVERALGSSYITSGALKRPPTCTSARWFNDVAFVEGNAGTAPTSRGRGSFRCAREELFGMNIDRFDQLLETRHLGPDAIAKAEGEVRRGR
jgi:hypothetical protein